jgi:cyclopropane fatty-acyl-phospholipid synthase-like methyltransferase
MPEENKPTEWFDPMYRNADNDGNGVPWANMETHPSFRAWLDRHELLGQGKTALVVGCGFGDDAIELASHGFTVTAFDVSEAAIAHCKRRFPDSSVNFLVADLFKPNPEWNRQFDIVLEIYTIQALPPKYESEVIGKIANFVSENGQLLVVAIVSEEERTFESGPPWALTPAHIESFVSHGLEVSDHFIREKASSRGSDVSVTTFIRRHQSVS